MCKKCHTVVPPLQEGQQFIDNDGSIVPHRLFDQWSRAMIDNLNDLAKK
jgi:hypothetical protein